ncbi:MAG: hypothetical protein A2309_05575 [Bacteroidetes bacterium RIFOXYB2_FULL_35_7]|nr:MAG: hypothetical protein A2X01_00050 [Bacteroidetes bacterium GWF2_35_48]OFY94967.1 MAG: hypothetical protein A2309_05575 [Bacteroidetes bacterium RIFOXYB2_FULL_35_7]OFZ04218.1 MAG: hypothetical protein A2491_18150 [Bacteroidetes bacterium RIFOXYC12_FULL_35_7]HBX53056.1 hypothetical protein [Bacteroidales bacterium]
MKQLYKLILCLLFLLRLFHTQSQNIDNGIELIPSNSNVFFSPSFKPNNFTGTDTTCLTIEGEKIKILIQYEKGVKTKVTATYDNNQVCQELCFNEKGLNDVVIEWYKNGKKKNQTYCKDGKYIYPEIRWSDDGSLEEFIEEDSHIAWYRSGKIESTTKKISEHDAKVKSEGFRYYENGQLVIHEFFNCGNQPYIWYFKDGSKGIEGTIFDGPIFQLGKWQEWYESGKLKREYFFHETIPNQKEGTWKWWDEKGNLIREEYYKNGEKIGEKEYIPSLKKG